MADSTSPAPDGPRPGAAAEIGEASPLDDLERFLAAEGLPLEPDGEDDTVTPEGMPPISANLYVDQFRVLHYVSCRHEAVASEGARDGERRLGSTEVVPAR